MIRKFRSTFLSAPLALSLALALVLLPGCKPATEPDEPAEPTEEAAGGVPKVEAPTDVDGVLKAMIAAYQGASSYADAGSVRLVADVEGQEQIDQRADFAVTLVRPNKIRLDIYQAKLVSDGEQIHAAVLDLPDQVLVRPAPEELTMRGLLVDRILNQSLTRGFAGPPPQLGLLLDRRALKGLLFEADSTTLGEQGKIDGRDCFRVEINRSYGTDVLYVDRESFVLRRVVYATGELRQMLGRQGTVNSISLVADFTGAQLGGKIDPKAFAFEVPEGARIVKFFIPPHPGQLLGKPVPDFEFVDLEGNPVGKADLSGKVTVLDFWATWCQPCRMSLPNLNKVYQKYKDDRRVAVLSVSVDDPGTENRELQKTFAELEVQVPIVRDPKRAAQKVFKSSSIPTLVVIDGEGVVQDFEIGVNANLEAALSEKIEKLLAGQDIFQEPLKKYEEMLEGYQKLIESAAEKADGAEEPPAEGQGTPIPKAEIAKRSAPNSFRLVPVWKNTELRAPGNILVVPQADGPPRILVVDVFKSIAEIGPDGKLLANHVPPIGEDEFINALRTAADADGKRYFVAFALTGAQQRCHLLDAQLKLLSSYPADALENRHSGIADVALGDLDGDGNPELCVAYFGVVGVQAASLAGERLWGNRSIANVVSVALSAPDGEGRRGLVCTNTSGSPTIIDHAGKTQGQFTVTGRLIERIAAADLEGDGQLEWCGMSAKKLGEQVVIGLDLTGKELYSYTLPVGVHQRPVELIVPGRLTSNGPGQWLLPAADGSIHLLAPDGTLLDKFNYGATISGLATAMIDGQAVLLVCSPNGLEAWKVQ